MSKHDPLFIKKFQPKESETPVMDAIYDLFKTKDRHRKHRAAKRLKRTRFNTWY